MRSPAVDGRRGFSVQSQATLLRPSHWVKPESNALTQLVDRKRHSCSRSRTSTSEARQVEPVITGNETLGSDRADPTQIPESSGRRSHERQDGLIGRRTRRRRCGAASTVSLRNKVTGHTDRAGAASALRFSEIMTSDFQQSRPLSDQSQSTPRSGGEAQQGNDQPGQLGAEERNGNAAPVGRGATQKLAGGAGGRLLGIKGPVAFHPVCPARTWAHRFDPPRLKARQQT